MLPSPAPSIYRSNQGIGMESKVDKGALSVSDVLMLFSSLMCGSGPVHPLPEYKYRRLID